MGERHITKRQENYAKLAKAIRPLNQIGPVPAHA